MDHRQPRTTMTSNIIRQGLNWVIITRVDDFTLTNQVLDSAYDYNFAQWTSAKGKNSQQRYLTRPNWWTGDGHREPENFDLLKEQYTKIVRKELVHHGLMPFSWANLDVHSAWTVTGEEGSYHTLHEHGYGKISTVTYLKVPPPNPPSMDGGIYLVMHADGFNEVSGPNMRVLPIYPEEGMMLIFPSWILHGVYPQGPGTRQTISFDFKQG